MTEEPYTRLQGEGEVEFRRIHFLPAWLNETQISVLAHHYADVDEHNRRWRVRPYPEGFFAVLDQHSDQMYHTQKSRTRTRRVWTVPDVMDAVKLATAFNQYEPPKPKEETSLSQRIAYINQNRSKREKVILPNAFRLCGQCQQMVKGEHNGCS